MEQFTIINQNVFYTKVGIKKYPIVKSFRFGEMGWSVKYTRKYDEAKTWKTYQGAYNAAVKLGSTFLVVKI